MKASRFDRIFLWGTAIILFLGMFVMFGTGGNLEDFYRGEPIFEADKWQGQVLFRAMDMGENGYVRIGKDTFYVISSEVLTDEWKYYVIDIAFLDAEKVTGRIELTKEEKSLCVIEQELKEGRNIIEAEGEKGANVLLTFKDAAGTEILVSGIGLWRGMPQWNPLRGVIGAVVVTILFIIILSRDSMERRLMNIQGKMCRIYGGVLEKLNINGLFTEMTKHRVRVGIFLGFAIYSTLSVNLLWRSYDLVVYSCLLILLAVMLYKDTARNIEFTSESAVSWLCFCLWMIISDFVVGKSLMWAGYILLFGWGLVIYAWNTREHRSLILLEMEAAIHISYIMVCVFCLMCRPDDTVRYMGIFRNPNMFGFYLVVVLCACLDALNGIIKGEKGNYVLYVVEGISVLFWISKTQARTSLLTAMLLIGLWLCEKRLFVAKELWRKGKRKLILLVIVCAIPVCALLQVAVTNLPNALGTTIRYDRDLFDADGEEIGDSGGPLFAEVVHAETTEDKLKNIRRYEELDRYSTGRISIWINYLKELNLFGHYGHMQMYVFGAHNLLIGTAYRYGIFVLMPYIMMWGYVLRESWLAVKEKQKHAYFMFAIIIAFLAMASLNDIERRCAYLIWIYAYTVLGYFFVTKEENSGRILKNHTEWEEE